MNLRPIFYSFRRCPYAMRARLAIFTAGIETELREIVLRDKAPEFISTSPKATVPVLVLGSEVLEESLDIMRWALNENDPEAWLDMPGEGHSVIAENDSTFKAALDRTKYYTRYDSNPEQQRQEAGKFLNRLACLSPQSSCLFGDRPSLADMAVLPFVRQFANIDRDRFNQDTPRWIQVWLDRFLESASFNQIMHKYPRWAVGDPATVFPTKRMSKDGDPPAIG